MEDKAMEQAFVEYLKSKPNLKPMIDQLKDKYKRSNKVTGLITMQSLNKVEREEIGALLRIDYTYQTMCQFSIAHLQKQLALSKFGELDLAHVLYLYYEEPIVTNFEAKRLRKESKEQSFNAIKKRLDNPLSSWVDHLQVTNPYLLTSLIQLYNNQRKTCLSLIKALKYLPYTQQRVESLTLFSSRMSTDPHFFDTGITLFFLLSYGSFLFKCESKSIEQKNKLLYQLGLVKEDNLNFCMIAHMQGINQEDCIHEGLKYFYDQDESLNIHLGNIIGIKQFTHVTHVLIIENPSVFQILKDRLKQENMLSIGLICTTGELNFAGYVLLDKVLHSSIKMMYCGDFDPEGLLIADKLVNRYEGALTLLGYTKKHYLKAISVKPLHVSRLSKLKHCKSKDVEVIKELLHEHRLAAYQELLIDDYMDALKHELLK